MSIRAGLRLLFALVLLTPAAAYAQSGPALDISHTENCLVGKQGNARLDCVGEAANLCMDTDGGSTTVGMGFCLNEELEWWDARLNRLYGGYLATEKQDDAENQEFGLSAPLKAPALQEMQRTWIKYRDALCEHAAAQWGGGTGQGPAFLSCLLGETGRQVLVLEDRRKGWE